MFSRQSELISQEKLIGLSVVAIGAGQIGSWTALALAKMGFRKITIIDPDIVETVNVPNQVYSPKDVTDRKVNALRRIVKQLAPWCELKVIPEKFIDQKLEGIVISGVDTMKARKDIWNAVKWNVNVPLYIDGRIGAEIIQIFTVRPYYLSDIEFYEKYLFSDEEASRLPCGRRGIVYVGMMASSIIASQVKKWIKKESYSRLVTIDIAKIRLLKT